MHIFPTELPILTALLQSVVYVAMGITLAWIYEKEQNIIPVIIVHAANNLLGIITVLLFL